MQSLGHATKLVHIGGVSQIPDSGQSQGVCCCLAPCWQWGRLKQVHVARVHVITWFQSRSKRCLQALVWKYRSLGSIWCGSHRDRPSTKLQAKPRPKQPESAVVEGELEEVSLYPKVQTLLGAEAIGVGLTLVSMTASLVLHLKSTV